MKKIFLSLLAAILYICSVGSASGQGNVQIKFKHSTFFVSNTITSGTVWLKQGDEIKYTLNVPEGYNNKTNLVIENVTAGDYDLSFDLKGSNNLFYYAKKRPNPITVPEAGKTFTSSSAETQIDYYGGNIPFVFTGYENTENGINNLGAIANATVTCSVEGKDPVVKQTDANGTVYFELTYNVATSISFNANDYIDTTFSSTNFVLGGKTWEVPVRKKEVVVAPTATVNGTVTVNGKAIAEDNPLPAGLSLRITPAEGEPMTMALANGQFEFEKVPEGAATFQLYEGQNVAYEFRVSEATKAMTVTADETANTHAINIERFASKVVCTFDIEGTPETLTGEVYLKKDGETEPAYILDLTKAGLTFLTPDKEKAFRGVLPGTYHIEAMTRQGYSFDRIPDDVTVSIEGGDVALSFKMVLGEATIRFSPAAGSLNGIYNKYLGETVSLLNGAKLELWNKEKTERLDTAITNTDGVYLKTVCSLGDEFVVTISREDIYPAETTVTVTSMSLYNNFSFEGKIRFIPVAHAALELKAVWNDATKATLTWEWPEAEKMKDLVIAKIVLSRRVKGNNEWTVVKTWEAPAMDALPTTFNDTEVAKGSQYTYELGVFYSTPENGVKRTTCEMDARFRYKLEFSVNDEKMGTITGGQPGNYLENTQIELTALPNPNYEFVAWKSGDDTVAKTATILFNISQDTNLVAIFKNKAFKISVLSDNSEWGTVEGEGSFEFGTEVTVTATPAKGYKFVAWKENTVEVSKEAAYKFTVEKDRTLIAVFEEEVANEDLEASRWAIFAENGTLVINGLDGDRYTVYDLNGRMAGQALCTGTEIRMTVAPNQLYIVRRISAQGAFGFKKIVVR